ncbi:MAG: hypothetical protein GY861_18440 [bacterium]|nr:hypothetical protein [bacterium]
MTEEIKDDNVQEEPTSEEVEEQGEAQDTPAEPPIRKSNADYAAERIAKKDDKKTLEAVEALKKEVAELKSTKSPRGVDDEMVRELATKQEVSDFVGDNPSFAKHKAVITEWAKHPAYANVPIEQIARMIAFDDAAKIGATEAVEIDDKAADSKLGGTTSSGNMAKKKKTLDDYSDDEIIQDMLDPTKPPIFQDNPNN